MNKRWLTLGFAGATIVVMAVGVRVLKRDSKVQPTQGSVAAAVPSQRSAVPIEAAEVVYDGALKPGWEDWGWGPHELGKGPARVVFQGFGGILFHHTELALQYGGISFRYKAPEEWGEFMHVSLRWAGAPDSAFPVVPVEPRHVVTLPGKLREVLIDWSQLNPEGRPFDRILIGSRLPVASDWVEIDRVVLTKASGSTPVAAARDGALRVQCKDDGHPISELIYGGSTGDWNSGQSAHRMGGNPHSRLNWELGAWNTGNDWYYENVGHEATMFDVMRGAAEAKRTLAFVIPMTGWVAKDKASVGFPRDKFKVQRKFDPYRPQAGDGFTPDGKPITPLGPEQTSMPAPPELIGAWTKRAVAADGRGDAAALKMFILDNEPTLWNTSHRDIHPEPLSYDELLDRTIKYASAVREAAPDALLAGPAEWGWVGYHGSAVDREAGSGRNPDRAAHGGLPLVAWYLRKLAEHERTTGKRLLDVFDLHFYPAREGVYGPAVDPAMSELRLRSTRALWDPTYRDESWVNDTIRLIPRMREWVRENYPGLKLSIGEWSFGAGEHISGGLAAAEALGRFGQQRLDVAFHWGDLKEGTPVFWAFRAFRNFDGKGARFLPIALPVTEADRVSLFASRDEARKQLVLVVINRSLDSKINATLTLDGCERIASSRRFSYGRDSKALAEAALQAAGSEVKLELEPFSLSVLDLKLE